MGSNPTDGDLERLRTEEEDLNWEHAHENLSNCRLFDRLSMHVWKRSTKWSKALLVRENKRKPKDPRFTVV